MFAIFFLFSCSAWLKIIDREDLHSLRHEYVYNNGRLCCLHFKSEAFTSTLRTKLSKFAVPFLENDSSDFLNRSSESLPSLMKNQDSSSSKNPVIYSMITSTPKLNAPAIKTLNYSYKPISFVSKHVPQIQCISIASTSKADNEHSEDFENPHKVMEHPFQKTSENTVSKLTPKTKRIKILESSLAKCKRKIFNLENPTNTKSFLKILRSKLSNIQ